MRRLRKLCPPHYIGCFHFPSACVHQPGRASSWMRSGEQDGEVVSFCGCPRPPFPGDPQRRPIDSSCPNRGDTDAASPKGQQNLVRNNLCKEGDSLTLSFND